MSDERRCDGVREQIAELALGIASGDERARVLEHTAGCPACRRLLDRLALVGDELLQLAPEHEPPAGFETRVIERLGSPRRRGLAARLGLRGRRAASLTAIAAAVAAGGAAAAGVLVATNDERQLGSQLQAMLSRASGKYIAVTELRDPAGREVGLVFHYGGERSWVFTTLDRPLPAGRYVATLFTRTGAASTLGTFALDGRERSFGATARIDMGQVTRMELRDRRGGPGYVAQFQ
jgi:hypothetical protein